MISQTDDWLTLAKVTTGQIVARSEERFSRNAETDITGIEGRALDSLHWELFNYVGRYIFDIGCRKNTVRFG